MVDELAGELADLEREELVLDEGVLRQELAATIRFEILVLLLEVEPEVAEEVLVDVLIVVATSPILRLVLPEPDVVLEQLRNLDDLVVGQLSLAIACEVA